MNQKLIKTEKAELLVLDLPKGATNVKEVYQGRLSYVISPRNGYLQTFVFDTQDYWQPLGFLHEVSEEQWEEVLEYVQPHNMCLYADYNYKPTRLRATNYFNNARQSGLSLIEANVSLKNPYGLQKQFLHGEQGMSNEEFDKRVSEWQEAEQNVFHNPFILVKKD